jgi:Sulfotransferase family
MQSGAKVYVNCVNAEGSQELTTVLYVGGDGRSGSTILATLLGQSHDLLPVGELRGVWNALRDNELCSCGESVVECGFWQSVGEHAFGGWDHAPRREMALSDSLLARHRRFPRLLLSSLTHNESDALQRHRETLARLYAAVREVSNSSVIIDSTKNPGYALLLRDVAGLDVRFVHLVRDSRAVTYSWGKDDVKQPEYDKNPVLRGTLLARKSLWRSAIEWDVKNVLLHVVERPALHCTVTYESLMLEPERELARVIELVADARVSTQRGVPEVARSTRALHMIGGNRVRFRKDNLRLRVDNEWRHMMPRTSKFGAAVLTFPLLIAYGYVRPFGKRHHVDVSEEAR